MRDQFKRSQFEDDIEDFIPRTNDDLHAAALLVYGASAEDIAIALKPKSYTDLKTKVLEL